MLTGSYNLTAQNEFFFLSGQPNQIFSLNSQKSLDSKLFESKVDHRTLWSEFPLWTMWRGYVNLLQAVWELSISLGECPIIAWGVGQNPWGWVLWKEKRLAYVHNVFQIRKRGKDHKSNICRHPLYAACCFHWRNRQTTFHNSDKIIFAISPGQVLWNLR